MRPAPASRKKRERSSLLPRPDQVALGNQTKGAARPGKKASWADLSGTAGAGWGEPRNYDDTRLQQGTITWPKSNSHGVATRKGRRSHTVPRRPGVFPESASDS